MRLSAPNRSVQEWNRTIENSITEDNLRIANRISYLIFGLPFSEVIHYYYYERCQFINNPDLNFDGPFYLACDRFLSQQQDNEILELSRYDILEKFHVFHDTLHHLIIVTASQVSKQKMKSIEADIAEQRSYFIALANGDAHYVDYTIQKITEMLYEYKVYDNGDEETEEKTSISLEPVKETILENNIEILFDFKPFKQSRLTPHFLFPGAINKHFFTSISRALKKQGFISSAELFVYRFFPVMEEDINLEQPLIWYGEFESLVFLFRLFISENLILDLSQTKKGKSLVQLLSETFSDYKGIPLKANTLRKTTNRNGIVNEKMEVLLTQLNQETGAIHKIFKACNL